MILQYWNIWPRNMLLSLIYCNNYHSIILRMLVCQQGIFGLRVYFDYDTHPRSLVGKGYIYRNYFQGRQAGSNIYSWLCIAIYFFSNEYIIFNLWPFISLEEDANWRDSWYNNFKAEFFLNQKHIKTLISVISSVFSQKFYPRLLSLLG